MTGMDTPPLSRRAAAWSARRQTLETWLQSEPQGRQAWEWRLRLKILNFLLSRYGNSPLPESETFDKVLRTLPHVELAGNPKPLVSPSQMRRVLTKASAINRDTEWTPFTEDDCYPPSLFTRLSRWLLQECRNLSHEQW